MTRISLFFILFTLLAGAPPSDPGANSGTGSGEVLSRRVVIDRVADFFEHQQYRLAADLLEEYAARVPHDAPMLYNLACAFARLGMLDDAADRLYRAVEAGFSGDRDIAHMRLDPDLAPLRNHPVFLAIIEANKRLRATGAYPAVVGLITSARAIAQWKNQFPDPVYRYEIDSERRLAYAVALDDTGWNDMRHMLEVEHDQLTRTLFPVTPEYDVFIAVPTPADADAILKGNHIGGMYSHDYRRLITRDIGASLRHEFFHLLHYRHMEKLHQEHALWIQEGLASLYENYDLQPGRPIRFLPNERHNVAKSRQRSGVLTPWKKLFVLSTDDFMQRSSRLYPEVRSIFEFVADSQKLKLWYDAYTTNFNEDSTGRVAFEKSFGGSLKDIEREWRRWLADSPRRDDRLDFGDASLGVHIDPLGANDGVLITGVLSHGAASLAELKRGDIIVAIDNQPIRTPHALAAALAPHRVGDRIQIRIRRDREYITREVTLRPLRGGQ